MQLTLIPMLILAVTSVMHIGLCYFFIYEMDMDIAGLGLASICTSGLQFLLLLIYSMCVPKISEAIMFFNADCFRDLGSYLRMALPSTVMLCAEWWCFELIIIMAGWLGVVELAAQVIIENLMFCMY